MAGKLQNIINKIKNAYISNLRVDDSEFYNTFSNITFFNKIYFNVCSPYNYIERELKKKLTEKNICSEEFVICFDINKFIFDCNWVILFWKNKYKQIFKENESLINENERLRKIIESLK